MSDFDFSVTSGKVTITGYRGKGGDVIVPDTIDGRPVTTIGDWAFAGCTGLTSITLPNSVTTIKVWAFSRCTGLTSVNIPEGCSIGNDAFYGCPAVITVRKKGAE